MGFDLGIFFHRLNEIVDYVPVASTGKGIAQLISQAYHAAVDAPLKEPENCRLEHTWRPLRREGSTVRSAFLCIPIIGNILVKYIDNKAKRINLLSKELKAFDETKLKDLVEWGSGDAAFSLGIHASLPEEKFWWFKRGAELGNADAMKALGSIYADEKKDLKQAAYWFKRAAQQGVVEAMYTLGCSLATGGGVKKDLKQAAYWYAKAAEKEYVPAVTRLAFCYEKGEGVHKDDKKAFRLFTQALQKGDTEAACHIGQYYQSRKAFPGDVPRAIALYTKAAEKGDCRAKYLLGLCHEKGEGVVKDVEKAVQLYKEAADKAHDSEAMYRLGLCFQNEKEVKDLQKAVEWHTQAINHGKTRSKLHLGECYKEQGKTEQAIACYMNAALVGDVEAQYRLGTCFQEGKKDVEEAVKWYTEAAQKKHIGAACALGHLYEEQGNLEQAVGWYEKAIMSSKETVTCQAGTEDLVRIYKNENTTVEMKRHILEFSDDVVHRTKNKHNWLRHLVSRPNF